MYAHASVHRLWSRLLEKQLARVSSQVQERKEAKIHWRVASNRREGKQTKELYKVLWFLLCLQYFRLIYQQYLVYINVSMFLRSLIACLDCLLSESTCRFPHENRSLLSVPRWQLETEFHVLRTGAISFSEGCHLQFRNRSGLDL